MRKGCTYVDGWPITYWEVPGQEGSVPLLFLHGVGGQGKMWAGQMKGVQGAGRRLAVNVPGMADGLLPDCVHTLSDYAPLIGRVLDELGIAAAVWVGNSFGGRVALEAALQRPEQVLGLGLIGAAGVRRPDIVLTPLDQLAPEEYERRVFRHPERFHLPQLAMPTNGVHPRSLYVQLAERTPLMDLTPQLAHIEQPARVIWGRHDGILPVALGEQMAAELPNAQLVVLEDAAHVPQLETPALVNAELELLLTHVRAGRNVVR